MTLFNLSNAVRKEELNYSDIPFQHNAKWSIQNGDYITGISDEKIMSPISDKFRCNRFFLLSSVSICIVIVSIILSLLTRV